MCKFIFKCLQAKELVLPERYVGIERFFDFDIGLIVLEERVPINNLIMPACIDWTSSMNPMHEDTGIVSADIIFWGIMCHLLLIYTFVNRKYCAARHLSFCPQP